MSEYVPSTRGGILLLDKPLGWTSAYASRRAGRLLGAKAGHAGALDPAATGLLVVGVGEGLKTLRYLTDLDKTYHACVRMGTRTTTDDREGELVERREHKPLVADAVREALRGFVGEIEQTPPMYSALKYRGKPLYSYARQNKEVPRKPRRVTVHSMTLLECRRDEFCFVTRCSHGTYIRVLARELGEALGGVAHLGSLRRVAVGEFALGAAVTPDAVREGVALPPDAGLRHFPELRLDMECATRLRQGREVECAEAQVGGRWRAYEGDKAFVGVVTAAESGRLKAERIFH